VNSGQFRSNIAFTNPNDQAITINYTLRRADGNAAADRSFALAPHTTRQLPLSDDVAADDSRLSLFWSATGRAYVVGSIIDNRSGDPASAPSVSRDATSLFFPIVGRTAGGNGTFWSTSASITGTSGASGSVTFAFTDATGRTYTRTAVLPALGSITTADVNDFAGAPAGTGALRITSTSPLAAVVRVFNTLADGSTFGSSVLAQDDVVRSTSVTIDGVRRDDDYRLNVTIANDDSKAADGRIRLFDDRGNEVENEPFHTEAGHSVQIGLPGSIHVRSGELRIETENGVPVTAVASNVDNITGDTMQRESEQEAERQNELEISMSTRTAAIGFPIAFSLKHASADVTAVKWQFGDGAVATGANVTHAYLNAGEFDVTVEVTLASGAIVRDREDLRITGNGINPGTTAIDFTYTPANPAPGQQVVFTATGATSGGVFKWKFPGDIRPVGNTVTFTFPNAGTFEVEVEIEHGTTTAEVTRTITVGGTPTNGTPGAGPIDFTYTPTNPIAGQAVTFTASGSTGGGTFKWKFPGDVRQSGPTATFTFAANGSYEVELEVEHGVAAEITKIVTVGSTPSPTPSPSTLDFTYSPSTPRPGDTVTFTATGATAGATYKWRFPGSSLRPTGPTVTFTFPSSGSFEVEVELEHAPTPAQITKIVTVSGSGTTPTPTPSTLDFTYSPSTPRAGQTVTFTATGNTAGGTYKWKFPNDSRPIGAVVTYTFPTAGSFEVELEVEHGSTDAEVRKVVWVSS
jgi:PKD repeat protein